MIIVVLGASQALVLSVSIGMQQYSEEKNLQPGNQKQEYLDWAITTTAGTRIKKKQINKPNKKIPVADSLKKNSVFLQKSRRGLQTMVLCLQKVSNCVGILFNAKLYNRWESHTQWIEKNLHSPIKAGFLLTRAPVLLTSLPSSVTVVSHFLHVLMMDLIWIYYKNNSQCRCLYTYIWVSRVPYNPQTDGCKAIRQFFWMPISEGVLKQAF